MSKSVLKQRILKAMIVAVAIALLSFETYWLSPDVKAQVHRLWWKVRGESAAPAAILCLDDLSEPKVALAAIETLRNLGPAAVPVAAAMLESTLEKERLLGARALAILGSDGASAFPAIRDAFLLEKAPLIKRELILVLRNTARQSDEATDLLAIAAKDTDPALRLEAVMALSRAKHATPNVVEALVAALKDPSPDVRREAAESIGELRPKDRLIVPALITALTDDSHEVRAEAGEALAALGGDARDAVPALVKTLQDSDLRVGAQARRALVQIGSESIRPLMELLKTETKVHSNVVIALGEFGKAASPALSLLDQRKKTQPELTEEIEAAAGRIRGE